VQAIADIPWWEPAADAAVDPFHDSLLVAGVELRRDSKVRLHPNRRADAQDLFLAGEVATVAAIVHDVDGGRHVAVTLDTDPAAEIHRGQGRFLYFSPDEVEPLPGTNGSGSSGPGGGADGARPRPRRVLVAGIGNVFLGDDGFGVEVARRLAGRPLPEGVQAADFGIRGIHLAYEMLEGYDALVLIDAMPLDEAPGTLAVVEPDAVAPPAAAPRPVLDAHTMHPGVVLDLLEMLDVHVERIVVIGCQPLTFDGMGLSPPVAAAVDPAVDLLEGVLADVCDPAPEAPA
jgi:hydrogenase maturation protease